MHSISLIAAASLGLLSTLGNAAPLAENDNIPHSIFWADGSPTDRSSHWHHPRPTEVTEPIFSKRQQSVAPIGVGPPPIPTLAPISVGPPPLSTPIALSARQWTEDLSFDTGAPAWTEDLGAPEATGYNSIFARQTVAPTSGAVIATPAAPAPVTTPVQTGLAPQPTIGTAQGTLVTTPPAQTT